MDNPSPVHAGGGARARVSPCLCTPTRLLVLLSVSVISQICARHLGLRLYQNLLIAVAPSQKNLSNSCTPNVIVVMSGLRVCAVARAITSGNRRGVTDPPSCFLVDRTAQGGALIFVQTITHDAADLKHMRVDAIHARYPSTLLYSFAFGNRS